ncbi:hypothetical protein BDV96DRAFT_561294 [Lophiotrema nucula]|uniref:Heterokaryon incompatibility domain-containing protein n=1 Tax=Lophiotrema nucula TaxID=690887 RepID=A0A6A5ZVA1_9PLEO|nr:hypothetical protein BDV96DRAFT_561294 [Lophiotrema nucula]
MAPTGPLSAEYALFSGSKAASSFPDNIHNWFAALETLKHAAARERLLDGLDSMQRISLQLLEEWWALTEGTKGDAGQWILHQEGDSPQFALSTYKKQLFELWEMEFGFWKNYPGYPESFKSILFLTRQKAAETAAAYRIARTVYELSPLASSPHPFTKTRLNPLITEASLPACLEACSWLETSTRTSQYPYYLWDIQKQETVNDPEQNPPYLVISHTWGRWEIPGQKVRVSGVPWPVPCNRLFNVQEIPMVLSRVQFDVQYVWLDLVCIPQDGSPLQQIEIGRQADIFSSARYAAIWANQIHDWTGLRATIAWLGLRYLQVNERDAYHTMSIASAVETDAQQTTGLAKITVLGEGERQILDTTVEPDGWFTSLWTLQEACLQPDMFLCDRNMNVMTIENSDMPISLGFIIALAKSVANVPSTLPSGPLGLFCVLESSELYNLLDMSPLDVIIFGNRRYCRDTSRAVAIMSALGFTDWYTERNQEQSIDSYIEGRYPLEFVSEAKSKLGAMFFATMADGLEKQFVYDATHERIVEVRSVGTTLPFRRDLDQMIYCSIDGVGVVDHPSVQSWSIKPDGSVEMPQVGIIASWPQTEEADTVADIEAWIEGSLDNRQGKVVGLSEWLGSFRPASEKYAICLLRRSMAMCCGILVERVYGDSKTSRFVKIGYFSFVALKKYGYQDNIVHFPPTRAVDWQVL